MRDKLLLSTLLIVGVFGVGAAACGDDSPSTPAPQPATTSTTPGTSGGPTPTPTTTGTTPGMPTPTPEPEWVAPKVATTSSGCGTAHANTSSQADYTTPAGRTYHVWGPSTYDPNKTYPVVMMFHGIQTQGAPFESWFKMESYTQDEAFVVYPDAAGANQYWDVDGDTDLTFFDDMIKGLGETYCINPSNVLGYGFSYGGHFADHLGCARAGYVKAIAIGDGGPGGPATHCGRLPVLVTTRVLDTNEYESYGKNAASRWMSLDGCAAASTKTPQSDNGTDWGYCTTQQSCKSPGGLTFCEDPTAFAPTDPPDWNHTVREYYRAYTYSWFKALQ